MPELVSVNLKSVERLIAEARPDELPGLLGELARLHSLALARLASSPNGGGKANAAQGDTLLTADEAAQRLEVSPDFLYRTKDLPFRVRIGRRLRFSARGIERYIRQRQGG